jgi:regulator of cell morphogenesis and NO signaling
MKNILDQSIGAIAAEDYRAAKVFEKYNIDFYCEGDRRLSEAARDKDLDPERLSGEISAETSGTPDSSADYNRWPLDELADYITRTHHRYSEEQAALLKPLLEGLCRDFGQEHPEVGEIKTIFDGIAGEMAMHMKREELMLFPFIRRMIKADREHQPVKTFPGGNRVEAFIHEHDAQKAAFETIAGLTDHYLPPKVASVAYRDALEGLKAFESDLHKHLHLENNILFPKATELEKRLSR